MKAKKSLRIFNSRFNTSTDSISLSSTVYSASVMIRKLGSMDRLSRHNALDWSGPSGHGVPLARREARAQSLAHAEEQRAM